MQFNYFPPEKPFFNVLLSSRYRLKNSPHGLDVVTPGEYGMFPSILYSSAMLDHRFESCSELLT
jgi:hypothetical protein